MHTAAVANCAPSVPQAVPVFKFSGRKSVQFDGVTHLNFEGLPASLIVLQTKSVLEHTVTSVEGMMSLHIVTANNWRALPDCS
jgi:hypothetical protein